MASFAASDPGKAIMQDAAIEVAVDDLSHIGPEKAIFFSKTLIIDLLKRTEIVFNTLIILGVLRCDRARVLYCPGFEQFKNLKSFVCRCPHYGKGREIFSQAD